jgi:pimeloyl-ACP methyl ester carboxylesterase
MTKIGGWLKRGLFHGLVIYLALVVLLGLGQRHLQYRPQMISKERSVAIASESGMKPWTASDGHFLGYQQDLGDQAKARFLILHGNAGFSAQRGFYAEAMKPLGYSCFIVEYPGYGVKFSDPGPTQELLVAEAERGLLELTARSQAPIWVIGESLGTGVASQLAARHPDKIAGLLLLMPFSSVRDVAQSMYWWMPVRWLVLDGFESVHALRSYHGPLLVVVSECDSVVPARFGKRLFESYHGAKQLLELPGYDHWIDRVGSDPRVWSAVGSFLLSRKENRTNSSQP